MSISGLPKSERTEHAQTLVYIFKCEDQTYLVGLSLIDAHMIEDEHGGLLPSVPFTAESARALAAVLIDLANQCDRTNNAEG